MKILFFIGTLRTGGKERRLVELLSYLKMQTDYEMLLVLRQEQIEYLAFDALNIPFKLLTTSYKKKDIRLPYQFYKICCEYEPDIIHTWGSMPASVAWPAAFLKRISLVNSQITSAPPTQNNWTLSAWLNKINFLFSDLILSNSQAGIHSYNPPKCKSRVIYNGVNLDRFENLPDKLDIRKKFHIRTTYAVVMVASFSKNKDYDLFVNVASLITSSRQDISFICVGDGLYFERFRDSFVDNPHIVFTGRVVDVEALINACDIGILFSNQKIHGEGISNTIMEYMASGKPVIANDTGGTSEIIQHGINGILINDEKPDDIADYIVELIDDSEKRYTMGSSGRSLIEKQFTIEKMGAEFLEIYEKYMI